MHCNGCGCHEDEFDEDDYADYEIVPPDTKALPS